jgi:hypothetical protein
LGAALAIALVLAPSIGASATVLSASADVPRGLTVAGALGEPEDLPTPIRDTRYVVLEVGDPVHEPGNSQYGNRTAPATLRTGPAPSTGGLAPPFLEEAFWVQWTKEPAGGDTTDGAAWRAGAWSVTLTTVAGPVDLDLTGTWIGEPHARDCEDDACQHEAAGPVILRGTIDGRLAELDGEARDAYCTEPPATTPGTAPPVGPTRTLTPCGD